MICTLAAILGIYGGEIYRQQLIEIFCPFHAIVLSRAGKKIDFSRNRLIDFSGEKNRFKIDFSIFPIFSNLCIY